jgi:hypothetical protein
VLAKISHRLNFKLSPLPKKHECTNLVTVMLGEA